MIAIDFVPGSHGNYLEFVLNKLLMGNKISQKTPFDNTGASHIKTENYLNNSVVRAKHFFLRKKNLQIYKNVVSIRFGYDDLLPLMSVSLQRAGNCNVISNLELDTYKKLSIRHYIKLRKNLYASYSDLLFDENFNPKNDCPRYILREFFKFAFKNVENNGYIQELNRMKYNEAQKVYNFEYLNFYDTDKFIKELLKLKKFFNLEYISSLGSIELLHNEFLSNQPQSVYKNQCNNIIDQVVNNMAAPIAPLTLLQESYINANLENIYKVEMPFQQEEYFKNTKEIIDFINATC